MVLINALGVTKLQRPPLTCPSTYWTLIRRSTSSKGADDMDALLARSVPQSQLTPHQCAFYSFTFNFEQAVGNLVSVKLSLDCLRCNVGGQITQLLASAGCLRHMFDVAPQPK